MHTLGRPETREQRPETSEQRIANREQRTENREQKDLRRAYCKTDVYAQYVQYSMFKEPEDPDPVQEANCHWAYVGARRGGGSRSMLYIYCILQSCKGGERERERERGERRGTGRRSGPGHRPPIRLWTRVLHRVTVQTGHGLSENHPASKKKTRVGRRACHLVFVYVRRAKEQKSRTTYIYQVTHLPI